MLIQTGGVSRPAIPKQVRYATLGERILANVVFQEPPYEEFEDLRGVRSPCWIWQGKTDSNGYGFLVMRKPVWTPDGLFRGRLPRNVLAHRASLHAFRGFDLDFPDYGCHECSVKPCCNPFHVEPRSNSENQLYYHAVEKPRRKVVLDREPGCDDDL